MSTEVRVAAIPPCDICSAAGKPGVPAFADARLSTGSWANVCEDHFHLFHAALGTGLGQRFVLRVESPTPGLTFEAWMQLVDRELSSVCGLSHHDLADYGYWDAWAADESPTAVAVSVLADNDFEGLG